MHELALTGIEFDTLPSKEECVWLDEASIGIHQTPLTCHTVRHGSNPQKALPVPRSLLHVRLSVSCIQNFLPVLLSLISESLCLSTYC